MAIAMLWSLSSLQSVATEDGHLSCVPTCNASSWPDMVHGDYSIQYQGWRAWGRPSGFGILTARDQTLTVEGVWSLGRLETGIAYSPLAAATTSAVDQWAYCRQQTEGANWCDGYLFREDRPLVVYNFTVYVRDSDLHTLPLFEMAWCGPWLRGVPTMCNDLVFMEEQGVCPTRPVLTPDFCREQCLQHLSQAQRANKLKVLHWHLYNPQEDPQLQPLSWDWRGCSGVPRNVCSWVHEAWVRVRWLGLGCVRKPLPHFNIFAPLW